LRRFCGLGGRHIFNTRVLTRFLVAANPAAWRFSEAWLQFISMDNDWSCSFAPLYDKTMTVDLADDQIRSGVPPLPFRRKPNSPTRVEVPYPTADSDIRRFDRGVILLLPAFGSLTQMLTDNFVALPKLILEFSNVVCGTAARQLIVVRATENYINRHSVLMSEH
jgi:hypothetical protein